MKRPKIISPKKGQESVWDYPRPPKLEAINQLVEIVFNGKKIVSSNKAYRVLETSHPPTIYIPQEVIVENVLLSSTHQTFCEWKGKGKYFHVKVDGAQVNNAAWYYDEPKPRFEKIKNHVAFYPSKMEACYVNGEKVKAQEGDFYGGWITSKIVGPFKGISGSFGW